MMVRLTVIFSCGGRRLAPADGLGLQLAAVGVAQHDAAAVGLDRAEDQLHDAVEQLIEVEDVADGLDGLVHDAEVGQGGLQPRPLDLLRLGEDAAAFGLADGLDDGRRQLHVVAGDHADALGQVAVALAGVGAGRR